MSLVIDSAIGLVSSQLSVFASQDNFGSLFDVDYNQATIASVRSPLQRQFKDDFSQRPVVTNVSRALVVIDAGVDDYELLIKGVLPDADVILLDCHRNGIAQIDEVLRTGNFHALQIVAHGSEGELQLGNTSLNLSNLLDYATTLQSWQLNEISLYACEVALGVTGRDFVKQLAVVTGAKVAAATTKVGNSTLGGTWNLAVQTGMVATPLAIANDVLANYTGLLAATQRVSVGTGGTQANNYSPASSISSDGRYVAFMSYADNLVTGDTNGSLDIFVYDRQTSTTQRVSVATGGTQANNHSSDPSISSNGRYVAFVSRASNLVTGDTNGNLHVFVYDRQTSTTQRVSLATGGINVTDYDSNLSISSDGRYVAFSSSANNLVTGNTNGTDHVFVYDRQTSTTQQVSVATGGTQGNSVSSAASISSDGRYVAFQSYASNLVTDDTNGYQDVFVYDRQTRTTQRVSVDSSGTQANSQSSNPSISSDGRYVAFSSHANNLVTGDTNYTWDIFVYDRQTRTTQRVSVATGGTQANSESHPASISSDGRYVAFLSHANNLVSGDTNNTWDIFVHDRQTITTQRVSVATGGTQANSGSSAASISSDGRYVAFSSSANNLVTGDTNLTHDIFVRDTLINQAPTDLSLSASSFTQNEGNSGNTPFTFTVTRSGDISLARSASFAVTGSGTNPANAADFGGTLPTGTVNFAAGETTKTITVNVSGDSIFEADETFTVSLSNPTGAVLSTAITATVTIINDDPSPTGKKNSDFNGDGKNDLVLQGAGWAGVWTMNGSTVTGWAGLPSTSGANIVGVGDFNGDGKNDIVLQNQGAGWAGIWTMNGSSVTGWAGLPSTGGANIVGVGDFNGDGKNDIVLQNQAAGWAGIWTMNGSSVSGWARLPSTSGANIVGVGDFNGDGKNDLILQGAGWAGIWTMNGSNVSGWAGLPSTSGARIVV